MDERLLLIDKSLNSINEEIYLRNSYIDNLISFSETKQIVVVEGQRRTGKSYIMLGLIKKLGIKEKTFYFNRENDVRGLIKNASDLADLFDTYCNKRGEPERVIIDEIQDIKDWENFIRAIYVTKKYKIIISGSNSHLLGGEYATYLSGRLLNFYVCPLGFDEYQDMIEQMNLKTDKSFISYMQSGGLPEVIKIDQELAKDNYTNAVLNTILVKDIMRRRETLTNKNTANKNPELITQILSYLANVTGSIVSVKNIVDTIQKEQEIKVTQPTITNYIDEIIASFAIHKVPRYNILGKHLFQQKDKYYFNDIGIRNSFGFNFNLDRGKLLENIVFLHLIRMGYKVYIGDIGGKEIDFVAKRGNDIHYLQVAWLLTYGTEDREFGNLSGIKDSYPKHVISINVPEKSNSNGIILWNIERFIKEFK